MHQDEGRSAHGGDHGCLTVGRCDQIVGLLSQTAYASRRSLRVNSVKAQMVNNNVMTAVKWARWQR